MGGPFACCSGRTDLDRSNVQNIEWFVLPVEHGSALESKPLVQYGRIHSTEVDLELQSAVIQIGEARMRPDETAFNLASDQKEGCGNTVACAAASILFDGSAEFRKRHKQNPVQQVVTLQIINKGCYRLGQLVQQCAMVAQLVCVVVESPDASSSEFDEEYPQADIGADELGDAA